MNDIPHLELEVRTIKIKVESTGYVYSKKD
jgi:hypothetical protein